MHSPVSLPYSNFQIRDLDFKKESQSLLWKNYLEHEPLQLRRRNEMTANRLREIAVLITKTARHLETTAVFAREEAKKNESLKNRNLIIADSFLQDARQLRQAADELTELSFRIRGEI